MSFRNIFLFSWAIMSLVACSDVNLSLIPKDPVIVQSKGYFCTKVPDETNGLTKFLFIMDKSGSNNRTDPGAEKRAGSVEYFYNKNKDNPNFRWAMVEFHGSEANALIRDGSGRPVFTSDENLVQEGLDQLRFGDGGSTPYGSALNMTLTTIQDDIDEFPEQEDLYYIFFITDGRPTDNLGDEAYYNLVERIVDLSPGRVFLSTAYYGSFSNAEGRLMEMARRGNGEYANFEKEDRLDFDKLITGPQKEPWRLKNLLVYNLNSAICSDGFYGADSDGDGVCDDDEIKTGLNPYRRSTLQWDVKKQKLVDDGYSDFFHWLQKKNQLGELPECKQGDRKDRDHDLLNDCEEQLVVNRNPIGTDRTTANPRDPDTDNDGILDGLELVIFRDTLGGALDNQNVLENYDFEPLDALKQIFEHHNPLFPDQNAPRYDIQITMDTVRGNGQTCYNYSQSYLQVYPAESISLDQAGHEELSHGSNQNVTMLYFIQTKSKDPKGKGILNYSFQNLKYHRASNNALGTAAGLRVDDAVFKSYRIPKK